MKYLEGVSLDAFGRGNRRLLAPARARHAEAKAEHAEALAEWRKQRTRARAVKDRAEREKALEAVGEKPPGPMHPVLVAIGCTVVGGFVLWPVTRGQHTLIAVGGAVAWVVVALIAGQHAPDAEPAKDEPETVEEPAGEEPAPAGPAPGDVHALVARLTAGGDHVLLTRVAADLASAYPGWDASTKAVRGLLAGAGIPVRAGVRAPDGNGPGIHRRDVPPLPSPTAAAPDPASVGVVAAGQVPTPTPTTSAGAAGGKGFVSVPDPEDPDNRTIIVYPADAA